MDFLVFGTDYKHADLNILESVCLGQTEIKSFLTSVHKQKELVKGIVILSTCNRIEIYVHTPNPQETIAWLAQKLADFKRVKLENVLPYFFSKFGDDAFQHLLEISSGIESMVFGESEILSQVKEAYQVAVNLDVTDTLVNKLFQTAISVGKKVRTQTSIAKGAYSVTSIAIEGVREMLPDIDSRKVLIVGAGVMGMRALKKWVALKHEHVYICNRDLEKLERIGSLFPVQIMSLETALKRINQFDVIMTAIRIPNYFITPDHIDADTNLQIIIDVGLPRNVDPQIHEKGLVKLLSLKELQKIADRTLSDRKQELGKIQAILAEETERVHSWFQFKHATL